MTQYTRPATIEDVKLLITALNAQGADYLLIGGYALFAHGYHRATEDIDARNTCTGCPPGWTRTVKFLRGITSSSANRLPQEQCLNR